MTPPSPIGSPGNPRPFPYVLLANKMKPGIHSAWKCWRCELPIVPDRTFTAADPDRQSPQTILRVTCPHCGSVDDRTWAGLRDIEYKPAQP